MVIIVAQVAVAYVDLYTITFLSNMDLVEFLIYDGKMSDSLPLSLVLSSRKPRVFVRFAGILEQCPIKEALICV
jgi:hypothetical protein